MKNSELSMHISVCAFSIKFRVLVVSIKQTTLWEILMFNLIPWNESILINREKYVLCKHVYIHANEIPEIRGWITTQHIFPFQLSHRWAILNPGEHMVIYKLEINKSFLAFKLSVHMQITVSEEKILQNWNLQNSHWGQKVTFDLAFPSANGTWAYWLFKSVVNNPLVAIIYYLVNVGHLKGTQTAKKKNKN